MKAPKALETDRTLALGRPARGERRLLKALSWTVWALLLAGAIYARLALAAGYYGNYDQQSFELAVKAVEGGGSAYATGRYPYAPGWLWILLGLHQVQRFTGAEFHTVTRSFLTLVDLCTAAAIFLYCRARGRFPRVASLLFLLNPITIWVTGYHGQFDNISLLFVVLALLLWNEESPTDSRRALLAGGSLGLSILIKHVTLFVPLVFVPRVQGWKRRAAFMALCYAPFVLAILPYWIREPAIINEKVFGYQAGIVEWGLRPILNSFGIDLAEGFYRNGLMAALAVAALVWSLGDLARACLLCMLGLFVLLPSFANQYTVWPVALGALDVGPLYVAYLVFGGSFLWGPVSTRGPEIGPSPTAPASLDWALFTNHRALWVISAIWFGVVLVEWAKTAPGLRAYRRVAAIPAAAATVLAIVLFVRTGRPLLTITCDNSAVVWIDGEKAGSIERWEQPLAVPFPRGDRALVAVDAVNVDGPGGLVAAARARPWIGYVREPAAWVCSPTEAPGWNRADFDDSGWTPAQPVARYGDGAWSRRAGGTLDGADWVWRTVPVPEQDRMYCRSWVRRPGTSGGASSIPPASSAR